MVLSQPRPFRVPVLNTDRIGIVMSWIAVALLATMLGWSYFSHPEPGPYGVCYSNKGRNACPPDLSKAGHEADLRLTDRARP
jgi:hypothetical protein